MSSSSKAYLPEERSQPYGQMRKAKKATSWLLSASTGLSTIPIGKRGRLDTHIALLDEELTYTFIRMTVSELVVMHSSASRVVDHAVVPV
jgi:hypothetical protein